MEHDVAADRRMLYIASPLRGDVEQNVENALRYCKRAIDEGYIPIAPHAMYKGIFNDEIPAERAAALQVGIQLLDQCSGMWVCGDRVSEGMRGEIARAGEKGIRVEEKPEKYFQAEAKTQLPKSTEQVRPRTFNELRRQVETAVESRCRDGKGVLELLALKTKHASYSVSNAMAIRQQNPNAKMVATQHQWKARGYRVTDYRHSVKVWKPVQQICFIRGSKRVDANAATPAENAAITKGTLPTQAHTIYKMDLIYDIAQTNCPLKDYAKVMENQYAGLTREDLYGCLNDVAEKCGFAVQESDDASLARIGGSVDGEQITISSRVHIDKKISALTEALSAGIVEVSSTQPEDVRQMESQCLSFLLQAQLGIPPTAQDISLPIGIGEDAQSPLSGKQTLEGSFGRVQRMLEHVGTRLDEAMLEHGLGLAPEQTAKKEHGLSRQQRDINTNFMMDLE